MTSPAAGDDSPERVVRMYWDRLAARDPSAFDLISPDFRQHAAAPQGRDGMRQTAQVITHDLGETEITILHVVASGDMVAVHLTLSGIHRASTMPLLNGVPPTQRPVVWTYMHLFRVEEGLIAEHWACRDDVGLLHQVGAWPPAARA